MFLLTGVLPDQFDALLLGIQLSLVKFVLAELNLLCFLFVYRFHYLMESASKFTYLRV
jgi:hypothetical protein